MNLALVKEKLDLYEKLMRLDKPIGILLLLWPTLWALWIAVRRPAGLAAGRGSSSSAPC